MSFIASVPQYTDSLRQTSRCPHDIDKTADLTMDAKKIDINDQARSLYNTQIALCIEIMQLMSDCITEGLCPRRTHKILLLLNQVSNMNGTTTPPNQLETALELTKEVWHVAHYQQLLG